MKIKKIIVIVYLFVVIFSMFSSIVMATESGLGKGFDYSVVPRDGETVFQSQTNKIWNSVIVIVRIATFVGIFLVGIRYMLSSADQRAEMKKNSIALVIGMVLVFTSTLAIDFVVNVFNQVK